MIKYTTSTKEINVNGADFKKIKNEILMQAIKTKAKLSPDQLGQEAGRKILEEEIDKFAAQLHKDNGKILPFGRPLVDVIDDKNEFKAVIKLQFYKSEEIEKLNIDEINFEFDPNIVTQAQLDEIFSQFIKNRPTFEEVTGRDIIEKDVVNLSMKATKDGQVVDEKENVDLQALNSESFSINSQLIGKKIGETFTLNDPANQFWTITIHSAKALKNVDLQQSESQDDKKLLNELQEQKSSFESNIKKELAGKTLVSYFNLFIDKVIEKDEIEYSPEILADFVRINAENEIYPGGLLEGVETMSQIDISNPKHKQFIWLAHNEAKRSIVGSMILSLFGLRNEIDADPKLFEIESKYAWEVLPLVYPNAPKASVEQIHDVLFKQLCVLKLLEKRLPEEAKTLKEHLKYNI
ncbi:trigger factor-related chaperone [Mycoplasma simbae]|uniref:trigger factor-related chaperone n=1 Tax=Mycoplasma simbae TaxID=36744 RepID=UPI0004958776|nr:hypothetical protein [Mycoplasma simbae]